MKQFLHSVILNITLIFENGFKYNAFSSPEEIYRHHFKYCEPVLSTSMFTSGTFSAMLLPVSVLVTVTRDQCNSLKPPAQMCTACTVSPSEHNLPIAPVVVAATGNFNSLNTWQSRVLIMRWRPCVRLKLKAEKLSRLKEGQAQNRASEATSAMNKFRLK